MPKYYRGNYFKDYKKEYEENRGWLVGHFMNCFRKTNAVEIKYWEFKEKEKINHEEKMQCNSIECTFILEGTIKGMIDKEKVILKAKDYVVIPPKVVNNFPQKILTKKARGITIKAPSIPNDKITKKMFSS